MPAEPRPLPRRRSAARPSARGERPTSGRRRSGGGGDDPGADPHRRCRRRVARARCRRGTTDADLDDLERRYAEDRRRIDGVAVDLAQLTVTQRQIVATYVAAKRQWEDARSLYQESASKSELATRTAEQAAADFAAAERYYRAAALAMVTISAGSIICGGKMSTSAYRRDLERKGMPMDHLEDVDHIFPKSRGGIDHPLNYQPLHRSLNRSLGNKVVDKFMQAPIGFLTGMAVSALGKIGGCH